MEFECFEPDPDDEFYDEMCKVAYATIFSERKDRDAENKIPVFEPCEYLLPVINT